MTDSLMVEGWNEHKPEVSCDDWNRFFKLKRMQCVMFTADYRKDELPGLRSPPDHVTGGTIVILHAYHHPLTQVGWSFALSSPRLTEFQRHFMEMPKPVAAPPPLSTAGGISGLCCGRSERSAVGNRCRETEHVHEKRRGRKTRDPTVKLRLCKSLERKSDQWKKNVSCFFFPLSSSLEQLPLAELKSELIIRRVVIVLT